MRDETVELFVSASQAQARARALIQRALFVCARAQSSCGATEERRLRMSAKRQALPATCASQGVDAEPTIEEAAERALLLALTAGEIAQHLDRTPELVMGTARARAVEEARAVDDVLRDWFRVLVP